MKLVWTLVAIVFLCGALCCGGVVFWGARALQTTKRAEADADDFALASVRAICPDWKPAPLLARLDDEADRPTCLRQLQLGKRLGPLAQAGPFTASAIRVASNDGATVTRVTTSGLERFASGSAAITMSLVRRGSGPWRIADWSIDARPNDGTRQV